LAHATQEQRIDDEIESVKALAAKQFAALTEAKARGVVCAAARAAARLCRARLLISFHSRK
jgi:hypothetical protein